MTIWIRAVLVAGGLASLLFGLMWALAVTDRILRNSLTPYECGFDPVGSARTPFSLRFFLLAILFLIFDVEVALLFPVVAVVNRLNFPAIGIMSLFIFILILLAGLYHECQEGSLDWA